MLDKEQKVEFFYSLGIKHALETWRSRVNPINRENLNDLVRSVEFNDVLPKVLRHAYFQGFRYGYSFLMES